MKLSRFISVSFVLSLLLFSCNKETNNLGGSEKNNSVHISKLGYKFNESDITKSGNKEKVVDIATVDIDDDYMLVAELVNVGNIEFCETKSKQDVTNLTVLTFYDQEAKGAPRVQENITTTFELPAEGGCTALFLGNVNGEYNINGTVAREGGKANSVSSGTNLCWFSKPFSGPISDGTTVDLSSMNPLFAQITTIGINQKTQGATLTGGTNIVDAEWPIESVTNAKIIRGTQATSGEISFTKGSVTYTKTADNAVENLNVSGIVNTTGAPVNINKDVIPNNNNFAISADVTLVGKTSKTATFLFNTKLSSGNRYAITLSIKKKGITLKYYVNTVRYDNEDVKYSSDFDTKYQGITATKSNVKIAADKKYYYKYGSVLSLPNNKEVIREKFEDFNPMDYMDFGGWYTNPKCTGNPISNNIIINVDNFPALKTGDEISLYAKWNPKFVAFDRYNSDILKMPTQRHYRAYIYNTSDVYYDESYTNDQQPGYWLKKWTYGIKTIANNGTKFRGFDDNFYSDKDYEEHYCEKNGRPTTNVNEYFFVPMLGIVLDGTTNGIGVSNFYWASDINEKSDTGEYMYLAVQFLRDRKLFINTKYYDKTKRKIVTGYNAAHRFQLLAKWPDPTYSNK